MTTFIATAVKSSNLTYKWGAAPTLVSEQPDYALVGPFV
jgi:hypothetical protein